LGDFIKIFIVLCAVAGAFFVGKGYGEKTFLASDEYKDIAKTREELDYAKNELENAKAKLQNIIDRSENAKTDELLGQILQVFLADLGLQIQNKDKILEQAKLCQKNETLKPAEPPAAKPPDTTAKAIEKLKREDEKASRLEKRLQAAEEALLKETSNSSILRNLDKVVLRNLANGQLDDVIEKTECEQFLGDYRGLVSAVTNQNIGTMQFYLNSTTVPEGSLYRGEINWYFQGASPLQGHIASGCGHKLNNLEGRIFMMEDGRFVQVYKLTKIPKIAGNLYEVLPNHLSKRVGKFLLSRTDKF
jgi:hypothetical protein